jgi:hypothetical protein
MQVRMTFGWRLRRRCRDVEGVDTFLFSFLFSREAQFLLLVVFIPSFTEKYVPVLCQKSLSEQHCILSLHFSQCSYIIYSMPTLCSVIRAHLKVPEAASIVYQMMLSSLPSKTASSLYHITTSRLCTIDCAIQLHQATPLIQVLLSTRLFLSFKPFLTSKLSSPPFHNSAYPHIICHPSHSPRCSNSTDPTTSTTRS